MSELPEIEDFTLEDIESALRAPRIQLPLDTDQLMQFAVFVQDEDWFTTQHELRPRLKEMLDGLRERQKEILVYRFGLGGGEEMTLEQLGQMQGVTRERIRQVEAKALDYLRHPIRAKVLREYFS